MIDKRDRLYRKFRVFKCPVKTTGTSTDGTVTVVKPKSLGKKIGKSSMMGKLHLIYSVQIYYPAVIKSQFLVYVPCTSEVIGFFVTIYSLNSSYYIYLVFCLLLLVFFLLKFKIVFEFQTGWTRIDACSLSCYIIDI